MRLTNEWYALVWVFVGGLLLAAAIPQNREYVLGKIEKRWSHIAAVLMVLPLIVWTGYRQNYGDTEAYRSMFNAAASSFTKIPSYLAGVTKDQGFSLLMALYRCLLGSNSVGFFLLVGAIQLLIIALVLRKYSCNYWLSIFVFVASMDYFSWMYNGMRQFLAVTVIFAATDFIVKRNFTPAVLLILLASTFHQSALLMIPVIFIVQGRAWNKTTVFLVLAAVVALLFIGSFTDLLDNLLSDTQYENVVADWQSWDDDGTNPIRVLVWSVPAILSFMGLRRIREKNDPLINICCNFSLITVALGLISIGTSGIFIGRLPIYASVFSNLILLPWEIEELFAESSTQLMRVIMILCYMGFFWYSLL